MFGVGPQEFLIFVVIVVCLSVTGLWPRVMDAFRELRGEPPRGDHGRPAATALDRDLCYRMLGLSPSATWEEIERAYRRKAKLHHPDLGGDEDTMRALNEAYQRLKALREQR